MTKQGPTPLSSLRQWGRNRVPLRLPEVAEVQIRGRLDDFGVSSVSSNISLPELFPSEVCADLALSRLVECTQDLSISTLDLRPEIFSPLLLATQVVLLSPDPLLPPSQTPNLLSILSKSGTAGKVYRDQSKEPPTATPPMQPFLFEATSPNQERCRHGLLLRMCDICNAANNRVREQKGRKPKALDRVVDVFDLLLAYLQPSIDALLSQPVLFPPDRRPYPYQVDGIRFLSDHKAALLGDEMGLGKTIQAIVALQLLYRRGRVRRTLILCPRSLLSVWESELRKWAPELLVTRVRGTAPQRCILWKSLSSVYLTTYETLREDISCENGVSRRFDIVILDEVQKIKNPSAGVTQVVHSLEATYRWGMSGTPLENRIEDVTSIFDFIEPSVFRVPRGHAASGMFNMAEKGRYESRVGWLGPVGGYGEDTYFSPSSVKQKIAPYFLRRRAVDVLKELPEKVTNEVWLDLTDSQRSAYDECEQSGRLRLQQPGTTRVHVFSLISDLKQICNLAPDNGESCKLDYLLERLESIVGNGQKALVFSQFPQASLKRVLPKLAEFLPKMFDGTLSDRQRESLIGSFQSDGEPYVLLMSVKAGGVGITLTRANHVFHFDHWWNPATSRQAEGRAHRIGQKETVFVHDLYTVDTIEERIYGILKEKQALFDVVIDDLSEEYVSNAFSDNELFGLFDLQPPTKPGSDKISDTRRGVDLQAWITQLLPEEFERLTAVLYRRMGYQAFVTRQSRDGGVDVLARRPTATGVDEVIIQCKHYPNGVVGEPTLKELIGTRQVMVTATHAALVTSGRFSDGATKLAGQQRIDLVDGLYLTALLKKFGVGPDTEL